MGRYLILKNPCCQGGDLWKLIPGTAHIGPVPISGYMASQVGPGLYLGTEHHTAYFTETDSAGHAIGGNFVDYFEGTDRHYLSPNRTRVLLRASRGGVGAGVIDVSTRKLAYVVPSVDYPCDAAWSLDGTRLYLGGLHFRPSAVHIIVVDALTGDSITARARDLVPNALALDPAAPLLYVAQIELDSVIDSLRIRVDVIDPDSLGTVAIVRSRPIPMLPTCAPDMALMVDAATNSLLLVVQVRGAVGSVGILHFALPAARSPGLGPGVSPGYLERQLQAGPKGPHPRTAGSNGV